MHTAESKCLRYAIQPYGGQQISIMGCRSIFEWSPLPKSLTKRTVLSQSLGQSLNKRKRETVYCTGFSCKMFLLQVERKTFMWVVVGVGSLKVDLKGAPI